MAREPRKLEYRVNADGNVVCGYVGAISDADGRLISKDDALAISSSKRGVAPDQPSLSDAPMDAATIAELSELRARAAAQDAEIAAQRERTAAQDAQLASQAAELKRIGDIFEAIAAGTR